ncbi:MAG: hypothetical protein CL858_32800 [Cupriavidus sp.]|nr:hypothetical protein [Cupriavidus sp.]MBU70150.1 hypothetical protein [Cupriavidus sp.]
MFFCGEMWQTHDALNDFATIASRSAPVDVDCKRLPGTAWCDGRKSDGGPKPAARTSVDIG